MNTELRLRKTKMQKDEFKEVKSLKVVKFKSLLLN